VAGDHVVATDDVLQRAPPGPIYEVKVNGQPLGEALMLEGGKHIAESFWQADEP